MRSLMVLPKKYYVHLKSPNELIIVDVKERDIAVIDVARALLLKNELKNKAVANRVLRALYAMTAMRTRVPKTAKSGKSKSITEFLPWP